MPGGEPLRHTVGRLPADVTTFVGRQQERGRIRRLLSTARLVTLIGPGGTGKTRLARQVAADVAPQYPDGVYLVDLAPIGDEGLIEYAIAEALDIPDGGVQARRDAVIEYLGERRLLLILDNCEHPLDGCAALVDRMLRWAGRVQILATSRQSLRIAGEHVWPVLPLAVPRDGEVLASDVGWRFPAVELFGQCAAAAVPGFRITADNREAVVEICRRVDGLPLAIELAAAQLTTLSLDQLAASLRDRLSSLEKRYATPAHHRGLLTTFDWSFELCSPAERALWSRLSVFVDSCDLVAAEFVCAQGAPLLDVIAGLVDKSVLLRQEDSGGLRYRLLEPVRQYGLTRLQAGSDGGEGGGEGATSADRGAERTLRRRHLAWYQGVAEEFHRDWFGPRQAQWVARLRRDWPNLRAALDFALVDGDAEAALEIATNLRLYWCGSGSLQEGRYWLDRALEANPRSSPTRGWALVIRAEVAYLSGAPGAEAAARESLQLATERADARLMARATTVLGACWLIVNDDPARAQALLERAVGVLGDDDRATFGIAQSTLAVAVLYQGDADRAADLLRRTAEFCRAHGDTWCLGNVLVVSGIVELVRGDPTAAEACVREGLALVRRLHDRLIMARAFDLLAIIAARKPEHRRAARLLAAARTFIGYAEYGSTSFRRRREEAYGTVRDALGVQEFDAAWAEGAQWSVDEAIAYALGDAPDQVVEQSLGPAGMADGLTDRERQVAQLVAMGLSNRQIATRLSVTQRTAAAHIENILRKLGLASRVQIATWYTAGKLMRAN